MTGSTPSGLLALLPARGGSKRIPRKNVADFHGRPILSYPVQAARESGLFDCIHVSSDDPEVREIAQRFRADTSLTRPAELADDFTGVLPVARWTLQAFAERGHNFSAVFILYPCSPLLTASDLIGAYEVFASHGGKKNLLTIGRNPVPAEWLYRRSENGALTPMSPGAAFTRSQDLPAAYYETGTFTIFSASTLLSDAPLTDDTNYVGYELPAWKAIDIDTPEDLDRARALYSIHSDQLQAAGKS